LKDVIEAGIGAEPQWGERIWLLVGLDFCAIWAQSSTQSATQRLTESGGEALKVVESASSVFQRDPFMSWEFTEDAAFMALCDAYKESGEPSAMEFLAHGEGAFHFQELTQNAAGEGIDLSDSSDLQEFQQEVIDSLEAICD
jgi:hypothetical protein